MQVFVFFAKSYVSCLYATILKSMFYTIEQTTLSKTFKRSTKLN